MRKFILKTPGKLPRGAPVSAPGRLELVRTFLNTAESLASPEDARRWLASRGLPGRHLSPLELEQLIRVRGGLYALTVANAGGELGAGAAAELEEALGEARFRARVEDDGRVGYAGASDGISAAIEALYEIVVEEQHAGRWRRLKACGSPGCGRVFYDISHSVNGKWCTLRCGDRMRGRRRRPRR